MAKFRVTNWQQQELETSNILPLFSIVFQIFAAQMHKTKVLMRVNAQTYPIHESCKWFILPIKWHQNEEENLQCDVFLQLYPWQSSFRVHQATTLHHPQDCEKLRGRWSVAVKDVRHLFPHYVTSNHMLAKDVKKMPPPRLVSSAGYVALRPHCDLLFGGEGGPWAIY